MTAAASSPRTLAGPWQRAGCVLVLVALTLAQTLGLMHRIVHAPLPGPAVAVAPVTVAGASRSFADHLKAMFAGHVSEHGCDLYDQSSHADVLPAVVPAVAVALPAMAPCIWHAATPLAAQAAGFLARGPPLNG